MMKKILTVLLALLMMLALVGCSSKEAADETASDTTELVLWCHSDEQAWLDSYQKIIDAFEAENPGITVRIESFPYDEFESKVLTSLASKEGGADLYEMWGGWATDYAPTGALAALPDAMKDEIVADAYPSTYGAFMYEGKLYGMPCEFNIEYGAMLANLNLLDAAGLEVATTWDELMEQAQKLTVEENGILVQKGFDFCNSDNLMYTFVAMMLQQGQAYMNEDGTFNFNNDAAKKAFEELAACLTTEKTTDLGELTDSTVHSFEQVYANITAYAPRGPWVVLTGINSFGLEYGKDYEYVALPWYGETKAFVGETGWSLAVNAKSEKQEAAFKFIEFFFQDENIMGHNLACGQIPAKKSVAASAEYLEGFPYAKPLVEILEYGQFIGLFNTERLKENINTVFIDYVTGGIYANIDEALADLEARCNAM